MRLGRLPQGPAGRGASHEEQEAQTMNATRNHWTDHSRERQLWCAVIDRALQDATRRAEASSRLSNEQLRERDEARAWFRENGGHFRHACESAGIDADLLRKRVLQIIADLEASQHQAQAEAQAQAQTQAHAQAQAQGQAQRAVA